MGASRTGSVRTSTSSREFDFGSSFRMIEGLQRDVLIDRFSTAARGPRPIVNNGYGLAKKFQRFLEEKDLVTRDEADDPDGQ